MIDPRTMIYIADIAKVVDRARAEAWDACAVAASGGGLTAFAGMLMDDNPWNEERQSPLADMFDEASRQSQRANYLRAQLDSVRELHAKDIDAEFEDEAECIQCHELWPCVTIQSIADAADKWEAS